MMFGTGRAACYILFAVDCNPTTTFRLEREAEFWHSHIRKQHKHAGVWGTKTHRRSRSSSCILDRCLSILWCWARTSPFITSISISVVTPTLPPLPLLRSSLASTPSTRALSPPPLPALPDDTVAMGPSMDRKPRLPPGARTPSNPALARELTSASPLCRDRRPLIRWRLALLGLRCRCCSC